MSGDIQAAFVEPWCAVTRPQSWEVMEYQVRHRVMEHGKEAVQKEKYSVWRKSSARSV
jgi:hypothetical protein